MVSLIDFLALIHPFLAVTVIFPTLGMVVYFAQQAHKRREQEAEGQKSKIPVISGPEHLRLGKILSAAVVLITLIGIAYPIFSKFASNDVWAKEAGRAWFVVAMFVLTAASLLFLLRARTPLWRGVFAVLTGMGLAVLGQQPEVFRREFEWWVSHYYFGMIAAYLMIFSLAIFPDIYRDRSNRWRKSHIVLNSIAFLFFMAQGMTGTRDLLEIPLAWQNPYVGQLYEKGCQTQPCQVVPAPAPDQAPPP